MGTQVPALFISVENTNFLFIWFVERRWHLVMLKDSWNLGSRWSVFTECVTCLGLLVELCHFTSKTRVWPNGFKKLPKSPRLMKYGSNWYWQVLIQPSPRRAFHDSEYKMAGATLQVSTGIEEILHWSPDLRLSEILWWHCFVGRYFARKRNPGRERGSARKSDRESVHLLWSFIHYCVLNYELQWRQDLLIFFAYDQSSVI